MTISYTHPKPLKIMEPEFSLTFWCFTLGYKKQPPENSGSCLAQFYVIIPALLYARYFFRVARTAPVPAISSLNISSTFSPIPASYRSIPKIFALERIAFS